MSTDYEDKEREFLAYLKADTGRDLAGWMSAIDEAGLAHRNEIIDWLRQQGFIFAWASWLERIHHNGGRPIYLDETPASLAAPPRSAAGARQPPAVLPPGPAVSSRTPTGSRSEAQNRKNSPRQPPASEPSPPRAPVFQPPLVQPPATRTRPVLVYSAPAPQDQAPIAAPAYEPANPPSASVPRSEPQHMPAGGPARPPDLSSEVHALIARAKAYTPLAAFILRSIAEALPGTDFEVLGNYIACNRPETFAILVPGSKDIKLGLTLASAPFGREVVPARFSNLSPAPPKSMSYMAILTDARQVDAGLLELLRTAEAAVKG